MVRGETYHFEIVSNESAAGITQVQLDSGADLLNLSSLDQKLWVALSCPVKGIEFDARTLAFVDSDGDGQVRAPERRKSSVA